MSDPNPWATVAPSVVTSAITTLVTMSIVGTLQLAKSRGSLRRSPLALRRGTGRNWDLFNRTNRVMTGVSAHVISANNQYRDIESSGGPGFIPARQGMHVGELNDGDTLRVNWVVLGRSNAKRWHHAAARVREDVEELLLKVEESGRPNGGR